MLRLTWVRGEKTDSHLRGRRNGGFSLIELSIVLVIIMSVLTLGMGALNSLMTSSAYSETKARQARIKEALIAYYGAHKRLPCPAWGNVDPTVTPDMRGEERKDLSTGVCIVDATITPPIPPGFGVVPYATLGLGRDVAEDGWGNIMSYQVYFENSGSCPGTKFDWTTSNCFGAGKPGGLWVYDGGLRSTDPLEERATYNATAPTDSRAVVVILSHGKNGFGAWTRQGTRNALPLAASCEELMNADRATPSSGCNIPIPNPAVPVPLPTGATTFIVGERPENDDVVTYLTADDVIQRLAKQGDILSPKAQVTEDLRIITQEVIGQLLNYGVLYQPDPLQPTTYTPLSVPTPPLPQTGQWRDPWGNPYRIIANISAISNKGVLTLNSGTSTPVCIYSYGPNGQNNTTTSTCSVVAGGDDIVVNLSGSALTTLFNNKGCASSSTC